MQESVQETSSKHSGQPKQSMIEKTIHFFFSLGYLVCCWPEYHLFEEKTQSNQDPL